MKEFFIVERKENSNKSLQQDDSTNKLLDFKLSSPDEVILKK